MAQPSHIAGFLSLWIMCCLIHCSARWGIYYHYLWRHWSGMCTFRSSIPPASKAAEAPNWWHWGCHWFPGEAAGSFPWLLNAENWLALSWSRALTAAALAQGTLLQWLIEPWGCTWTLLPHACTNSLVYSFLDNKALSRVSVSLKELFLGCDGTSRSSVSMADKCLQWRWFRKLQKCSAGSHLPGTWRTCACRKNSSLGI